MQALLCTIAAVLANFAPASFSQTGNDAKAELKRLDGTWKIIGIEIGGKKIKVGDGSPEVVAIKAGKMTIMTHDKPFGPFKDCTLKIDPAPKPKTMDIAVPSRFLVPAIYELNRQQLKLAIPKAPEKSTEQLVRPESFDSSKGPVIVYICKQSVK